MLIAIGSIFLSITWGDIFWVLSVIASLFTIIAGIKGSIKFINRYIKKNKGESEKLDKGEKENHDEKENNKSETGNTSNKDDKYVKNQLLHELIELIEEAVEWTVNPPRYETPEEVKKIREEKINMLNNKLVRSKVYLMKNYEDIYETSWSLVDELRRFTTEHYIYQKTDPNKVSDEYLKSYDAGFYKNKQAKRTLKDKLIYKISEAMSE